MAFIKVFRLLSYEGEEGSVKKELSQALSGSVFLSPPGIRISAVTLLGDYSDLQAASLREVPEA